MKRYNLKYLLAILVLLLSSAIGFCEDESNNSSIAVTIEPILSFDVNNKVIDFVYDEYGNEDNDVYDKNTFSVTGNVNWEFSIYASANVLTASGSTDEVSVNSIEIYKNDISIDGGVIITESNTITLSTTPKVIIKGQGSIPTSDIRLRWHFKNINDLGNIRAGFYTVPVIYQVTAGTPTP